MKNILVVLSFITLAASSSAFAQKGKKRSLEIATNQTINAGLVGGGINSGLSISTAAGSNVLFGIAGDVAFDLNQDFQISIPIILFINGGTAFGFGGGLQYNFGKESRMNQFFANFRPGLLISGGTAAFILNATFGKRFEIIPGVAYRPNFGISFNAAASAADFNLAPIGLSIEL